MLSLSLKEKLLLLRKDKLWFSCGPLYSINHQKIEIDVSYYCNLKCFNCNRSCRQAPSKERMTVEQIERFFQESRKLGRKWLQIAFTGGEPTLHPEIMKFIAIALRYKKEFSPATKVQIVTNGFGDEVKNVLVRLPEEVGVRNSQKSSDFLTYFKYFNIAPRDLSAYRRVEYGNGCREIAHCGLGLTPFGFYPCAVGGSIDRVFGFAIGRKKLPEEGDEMIEERKVLCQYCNKFRPGARLRESNKEIISSSWEKALQNYQRQKPTLPYY